MMEEHHVDLILEEARLHRGLSKSIETTLKSPQGGTEPMNGQYSIQILHKTSYGHEWRNDLRMQYMGKDFAKGAFFALKTLNGGAIEYRLVKHHDQGAVEVLGEHRTGTIKVN